MNRRTLLQLFGGLSVLPLLPNTSLASTSGKRVILLVHQALQNLMPLWERNEMAVIHGLGYPNPNRSHFKSIALWETGSDGISRERRSGWITHDIEHAYAVANIDNSAAGNWLSMETANQFSNRSIVLESTDNQQNNPMMKLLQENALTLSTSIDSIAKKVENNSHPVRPKGGDKFNAQIGHAINLVNAGVDAPVIKLSLDGFDTHENQTYRHKSLLKKLADGVSHLRRELIATDNWHNTTVITYSEFGRRAAENKSGGTDHGTAAPGKSPE